VRFAEVVEACEYLIDEVHNANPKFSGMGIIAGNTLFISAVTRTLVRFNIGTTFFFARKRDLELTVTKLIKSN
jgi:hypothetical protein